MLLKLFLMFIKINLLSVSGPASLGLTKHLAVPAFITETDFVRITSLACATPGSDSIQMALQIGYKVAGIPGAIVSVIGALLPCILLIVLVMIGCSFLAGKTLNDFFKGVAPALAVLLVITAIHIFPGGITWTIALLSVLAIIMYLLKLPPALMMLLCGIVGIVAGKLGG